MGGTQSSSRHNRLSQVLSIAVLVTVSLAQQYGPPPVPPHHRPVVDHFRGPAPPPRRQIQYGPPPPPPSFRQPPTYTPKPKTIGTPPSCQQEPCCLNKVLKATETPHGYGPKSKLNIRLFDECPLHKDDETICKAASEKFTTYTSALTVKTDYEPRQVKLIPNNKKAKKYEDTNRHDNLHAHSYSKVEHGSKDLKYKRVVHPAIINGFWYSDTKADLVAISQGCCYNIFGDVHVGDKLDTVCRNGILGDPNQLYRLLKYTIITPGMLNARCETNDPTLICVLPNGVIVGRDAFLEGRWIMNVSEDDVGQYWDGVGLQVGGDIEPELNANNDIGVFQLFEQIVNGLNGDRVTANGGAATLTEAEVEESRLVAASRVCALSDLLKGQVVNGECKLDDRNDYLVITCEDNTAQNCAVNCTEEELEAASSIAVMSTGSQVIINVEGKAINIDIDDFSVKKGVSVVWNFHKALVLTVLGKFEGVIVTPRALAVDVSLDLELMKQPRILNGNPGSTITMVGRVLAGAEIENPDPSPLARIKPKVTLCSCLCTDETCQREY